MHANQIVSTHGHVNVRHINSSCLEGSCVRRQAGLGLPLTFSNSLLRPLEQSNVSWHVVLLMRDECQKPDR